MKPTSWCNGDNSLRWDWKGEKGELKFSMSYWVKQVPAACGHSNRLDCSLLEDGQVSVDSV